VFIFSLQPFVYNFSRSDKCLPRYTWGARRQAFRSLCKVSVTFL